MYMLILFTNNNVRLIRQIQIRIIVMLTIFDNNIGLRELDKNNIIFGT